LITASTYPRWVGDTHPEFIAQLAQRLSAHYEVHVLVPHAHGAQLTECVNEVHITRFRYAPSRLETLAYGAGIIGNLKSAPWRWLLIPSFISAQWWALITLCRRNNIALVHAHWLIPQGLVMAIARYLGWRSTPVMLTCHGADLFALRGRIFAWLKRAVLSRADRVNVVSSAMLAPCSTLGIPMHSIMVRSMGVDLRARFIATTPWSQRQGLVYVGRLVEKKGVAVLVKAIAQLVHAKRRPTLKIIGDGPLRAQLEQLAEELGCSEQIEFVGAVQNCDVAVHLNAARIAIVPSIIASNGDQEGLGLVAVEAMGCGCALVCSDTAALMDVVTDGVNGLSVPMNNAQALANAIAELLDHDQHAQQLATEGRASALQDFDWDVVAQTFADSYATLLSESD
jgi:glycosyltransferase involved in cell wall biosynthesis